MHDGVGELAAFDEPPHDLADEKGIPLGPLVYPGDERLGCCRTGCRLDEACDLDFTETAQRQPRRDRLANQLGERIGQEIAASERDVSERADDNKRHLAQDTGEETQEEEGRLIGTLEVVQEKEQRPRPGRATE